MGHILFWDISCILFCFFLIVILGERIMFLFYRKFYRSYSSNFSQIKCLENDQAGVLLSFLIYIQRSFYWRKEGKLSHDSY